LWVTTAAAAAGGGDVHLASEPEMEIEYFSETYLPRLLQGKCLFFSDSIIGLQKQQLKY
jgi:hypothetical protein